MAERRELVRCLLNAVLRATHRLERCEVPGCARPASGGAYFPGPFARADLSLCEDHLNRPGIALALRLTELSPAEMALVEKPLAAAPTPTA